MASSRAVAEGPLDTRGLAIARAALASAPTSFAAFAPGVFLGFWLRSLEIRIRATLRYFWLGFLAMPRNWRRAVFCMDTLTAPEFVPGYTRNDPFNANIVWGRVKNSIGRKKYIAFLGLMILFAPAIIYRWSIKSTCWFYLPLAYVVRTRNLARNPARIVKRLLNDTEESVRRYLAFGTILVTLVWNTAFWNETLPQVIAPIEYVLLIDLATIRPWHYCNIFIAVTTIGLLVAAERLRNDLESRGFDITLHKSVHFRALFAEWAMRARNCATVALLLLAAGHVLMLRDALPRHSWPQTIAWLKQFYRME